MLVLTWVLNSTTVVAIQLLFLDEFVNRSRISELEHMTDKASYLLTLDFFHFIYCQKRCSALFDLHVWSNIGDNKTISLAKRLQE